MRDGRDTDLTPLSGPECIRWLARRAAGRGLRLRDARRLFDALYVADALGRAGGNVSQAAALAGVHRECVQKMRRQREAEIDGDGDRDGEGGT